MGTVQMSSGTCTATITFTQTNTAHTPPTGTVTQILAVSTRVGAVVSLWTKAQGSDGSVQQTDGSWLHVFGVGVGTVNLTPGNANALLDPAHYGIVDISDIFAVST